MIDNKTQEIIAKARKGEGQAIAALYDRHFQAVYNYIYYRVSDQHTAEDLSSEVFIRMLQKLPEYSDRGRPFLAWLYTIARNLVIDHYRSEGKMEQVNIKEDLEDKKKGSPSQVVQAQMDQECFREALARLPEAQRQMLMHRFINGFSFPDIAELLNKSDRALRSLQHRALRSLHKALVEEECL